MPRLTNLDEVLFPVEERPIFTSALDEGREHQLPIPGRKALVNSKNGQVLGVVSREYRLITNRHALEMAFECCRAVFPETRPCEWEAKGVDAPSTAGHCHIDLVHNSTALDFSVVPADQRPDAFGPFIRVTNSYHGLRALAFDVGYYRKVCRNGLIVPGAIVRFRFAHLRREMRAGLRAHLAEVCRRYAAQLGENGYALFNAITDFASHPPANRCLHRDGHTVQRLAGSWLTAFNTAREKPGFSIITQIREFAG